MILGTPVLTDGRNEPGQVRVERLRNGKCRLAGIAGKEVFDSN
jgi:hypothetical protein